VVARDKEDLEKSLFGEDDGEEDGEEAAPAADNEKDLFGEDDGDEAEEAAMRRQDEYEQRGENQQRVSALFGENVEDFFGDYQSDDEAAVKEEYLSEDSEEEIDEMQDEVDPGVRRRARKPREKTQEQKNAVILALDIPERLQARMTKRLALSPEDFEGAVAAEARWIHAFAFKERSEEMVPAIQRALTYMVGEEHLEVPFIWMYRRDQLGHEEPWGLQEKDLWTIDKWDDKW
jgi:hypothetical protein